MSHVYLDFTCDSCEFEDSDLNSQRPRTYYGDFGIVPVAVESGWCHACEGVEPLEVLPTDKRIAQFEAIPGEPGHLNWDLAYEKNRFKILAGRRSPARCLVCGGTDILPFPQAILDKAYDSQTLHVRTSPDPVPLGIAHPGCGGHLLVAFSNVFISLSWDECLHDQEGRSLPPLDPPPLSPEPPEQLELF